jgi:hypothetical protein
MLLPLKRAWEDLPSHADEDGAEDVCSQQNMSTDENGEMELRNQCIKALRECIVQVQEENATDRQQVAIACIQACVKLLPFVQHSEGIVGALQEEDMLPSLLEMHDHGQEWLQPLNFDGRLPVLRELLCRISSGEEHGGALTDGEQNEIQYTCNDLMYTAHKLLSQLVHNSQALEISEKLDDLMCFFDEEGSEDGLFSTRMSTSSGQEEEEEEWEEEDQEEAESKEENTLAGG